jgi:hypothetical protein
VEGGRGFSSPTIALLPIDAKSRMEQTIMSQGNSGFRRDERLVGAFPVLKDVLGNQRAFFLKAFSMLARVIG